MKKEAYFSLEGTEDGEKMPSIWFCDEFACHEVIASDIRVFFDFRMQIEMMGEINELSFVDLVRQAKELEKVFKECLKVLKKPASAPSGMKPCK